MNQQDIFVVSRNYVFVISFKVFCFSQTAKKIIHTLVTYLVRTNTHHINLTSVGCAELHNKSSSFAQT